MKHFTGGKATDVFSDAVGGGGVFTKTRGQTSRRLKENKLVYYF
jgi:hypothetical protein